MSLIANKVDNTRCKCELLLILQCHYLAKFIRSYFQYMKLCNVTKR